MKTNLPNRRNNIGLLLLTGLCVFLAAAIFLVQSRTNILQKMIAKMSGSQQAQTTDGGEGAPPAAYTTDLRIVLLDSDGDAYRESVQLQGTQGMDVAIGDTVQSFGPQEVWDSAAAGDADTVHLAPRDGELLLCHSDGAWSLGYEGTMELRRCGGGWVAVNEIDLERYLKRVVPSEMPRTYGAEALKAQAVCARTYAYAHSNTLAYPEVGAQMDDSTSFQVYNRSAETAEGNQAVSDTAGLVLTSGGRLIDALYYSTSCGYAQDGTLFGEEMDLSVLSSCYIGPSDPKIPFTAYIRQEDAAAYEAQERYFRWTAALEPGRLGRVRPVLRALLAKENVAEVSGKLKKRLCDDTYGDEEALGSLDKIEVTKRNPGGAAEQVKLTFGYGTAVVNGQLNIRDVLGAMSASVSLHNGETVDSAGRLPSAAFDPEPQGGSAFLLYGGGFGHGVGMSQNGAKDLAAIGFSYRDILTFFYKNTAIESIG